MTALAVLGFTCLVWGLSAVQCSDVPAPPPLLPRTQSPVLTPPPVAVYHAQREEAGEQSQGQGPPAPPPVNQYHSQREQQNKETDFARPLEREPDMPYNYQLSDSSLLENIIYDLESSGGLTALKDEDLQVCFIDHFTRPFIVPREQRRFYTHALSATLAENEDDHKVFKSMVGQHIYDLCRGIRTYWLDNKLLVEYVTHAQSASGARSMAALDSSSGVRAPPPVSLYRTLAEQQEVPVHAAPPALPATPAPEVKAPPPVAEYRLQNP